MKWQSEEHVALAEAAEWARHFAALEQDMDHLLADLLGVTYDRLAEWVRPGRYVSGPEFAAAGLAELVQLTGAPPADLHTQNGHRNPRRRSKPVADQKP